MTTRFMVNGKLVLATYLSIVGGGHVLQLLIESSGKGVRPSLHNRIQGLLAQHKSDGIMHHPRPKIYQEKAPVNKRFSEIRVLCETMLWVVDILRFSGFAVIEIEPLPPEA